jgi:hypothetical protein
MLIELHYGDACLLLVNGNWQVDNAPLLSAVQFDGHVELPRRVT